MGADGIEIDVHRCATGEAVVIHDYSLERVAGVSLDVESTSLARLRSHDVGEGERIPLLEEALEAAKGLFVNIELKVEKMTATGLERVVARVVEQAGARERVVFSCFHPAPLWRLRFLLPSVRRALLIGSSQAFHLRRGWQGVALGLHAVHPEHVMLDECRLARFHRRGLEVNTWTVNEPWDIRRLSAMGVDGVITDRPDMARDALMGMPADRLELHPRLED